MPSVREALASALDAAEGNTQETAPPAPEAVESAPEVAPQPTQEAAAPEAEAPSEARPDKPRTDDGRFAKAPKPKVAPPTVKPTVVPDLKAAPKPEAAATPAPEAKAAETLRAPQSWTPAEREAWAKVPADAQRAILRQDAEVRKVMQAAAPARKHMEEWQRTVGPYTPLLGGTEPLVAIRGLLNTVSTLATGTQQQRAATVANLIKGYGVGIEALAAALDGQPAPGGQPQQLDANALYQQVYSRITQDLTAQAKAQQAAAMDAEVSRFAEGHEFLDDVADEMAALIDAAARRGKALSYEDAYSMACRAHPDVSKVVAQREAAAKATADLAATQKARAASSSVRTQPTATPNGVGKQTVRSALEAAAERLNR